MAVLAIVVVVQFIIIGLLLAQLKLYQAEAELAQSYANYLQTLKQELFELILDHEGERADELINKAINRAISNRDRQ